VQVQLK